MAIFPGGPGLAGTIMYFVGAKDNGGGGDNWSYKTCKAPVNLSPSTNQYPVFTGRMPFLSSNQQRHSTEELSNGICISICATVHSLTTPVSNVPKYQITIIIIWHNSILNHLTSLIHTNNTKQT